MCSLAEKSQSLCATYISTRITVVPRSSETSVDLYQTTRHYLHLTPRLRMSGDLLLFPLYALMACTRQLYLHGFASWEKVVFVIIQLSCRVNSVCPNSLCFIISLAVACQVKAGMGSRVETAMTLICLLCGLFIPDTTV
jgi:hypothetical protein